MKLSPTVQEQLSDSIQLIFDVDISTQLLEINKMGYLETIERARIKVMQILFEAGIRTTPDERVRLTNIFISHGITSKHSRRAR